MNLIKLPSGCYLNTEQIVSISAPSADGAIVVSTTIAINCYRKEDANAIFQWAELAATPNIGIACSMCHQLLDTRNANNYHIDEQGDRICLSCLKGEHAALHSPTSGSGDTIHLCLRCHGKGKLPPLPGRHAHRECPACIGSGKTKP